MSFEIFMQSYELGQPSSVPEDLVRASFSHFEEDSEPDYWHITYDARNDYHVAVSRPEGRPDRIEALTVHRPCGDARLWTALYSILQLSPWVLYFPSESPPLVVAKRSNAQHLPPGMLESLGPIREVHSGEEIVSLIHGP